MALQWVWLELWLDPQQTSGEGAPLVMVASVAASLAAQDPQLAPDGAALATLEVDNHQQALCRPRDKPLAGSVPVGTLAGTPEALTGLRPGLDSGSRMSPLM